MRKSMVCLALGLMLVGCGEETSDPAQDAAEVAEIRATHDTPPARPLVPERISYTDVEDNNLFGVSCGFAPGNSLSVMVMAMPERAYMKLDGEVVTFAADKGSANLPIGAWTRYDGKEYSLHIPAPEGEGSATGIETLEWRGSVEVLDAKGRPVYEETGTLQCGS